MPALQVALGPLNERFNAANVTNHELNPPDVFVEGCQLADLVEEEEFVPQRAAQAFIEQMPVAIHEAIRAVIRADLVRERPLPITFAWQPGYDWELTVNDIASTDETAGGITVIVRSRYPGDPHPLDDGGPDAKS
jgi:hypothetical protein